MPRPVECLLVGTGSPASEHAFKHLTELARSRFDIEPTCLQGEQATKKNVLAAFEEIAGRNQDRGTLFVVLFSGHGGIYDERHFWFLKDVPLDDETIIEQLATLHRDSEVFLISDCCYGGLLLHKRDLGEEGDEGEELLAAPTEDELRDWLRFFTRRAAFHLHERGSGSAIDKRREPQGNVVLAAASDWLLVRGKTENDFTRALCEAIPRAKTYAALQPEMTGLCKPSGQCNWLIDAMPEAALQLRPLVP
jgi:Caspase domain